MTRIEKLAYLYLGIIVFSMICIFLLLILFPNNAVSLAPLGFLGFLGIAQKIAIGKKGLPFDEMEVQIVQTGTLAGYICFWVAFSLSVTLIPIYLGYSGCFPSSFIPYSIIFAVFTLFPTLSLYILYKSSEFRKPGGHTLIKKILFILLAVITISLPFFFIGIPLQKNMNRTMGAMEQKDNLYFTDYNNIRVETEITSYKENSPKIKLILPYVNGSIKNVLLNGEKAGFQLIQPGEYDVAIPERLRSGKRVMQVKWEFPIANIQMPENRNNLSELYSRCPYRTRLISMITVKKYSLTGIVDNADKFEMIDSSDKKEFNAFSIINNVYPKKRFFGSCGIMIAPKDKKAGANQ